MAVVVLVLVVLVVLLVEACVVGTEVTSGATIQVQTHHILVYIPKGSISTPPPTQSLSLVFLLSWLWLEMTAEFSSSSSSSRW